MKFSLRFILFIFIVILFIVSTCGYALAQTYKPNNENWLFNVRGAAILYYNTDDSTFYPVQGDTATGAFVVTGAAYSSDPVFTAALDSGRLTNAVKLEGRWIPINESFDGSASLFVSGDSISGTTATVTVSYQMIIAIRANGDTLVSEEFTLGTVAASLQKETIGDGYLIGETFIMGNDAEWTNKTHVKFNFLGTGTQVTDIISRFKRGR